MTALNAQIPATSLDDERRAHEPSMEEILASIRRIIADDDATVSTRRDKGGRHESASAYQDEAHPALAVASPSAIEAAHVNEIEAGGYAAAAESDGGHDACEESAAGSVEEHISGLESEPREEIAVSHDCYEHAAGEQDYYQNARESHEPAGSAAPLVSPDAAASITAQFQTLAASMVINDSGLLHDYAREMLRPMLKAWLDDNLPVLVERLVRAEIERVARGGRR